MKNDIEQILDNIRIATSTRWVSIWSQITGDEKVELRNALVNAASPYGNKTAAEMVGKTNHTTAIHICREHQVYYNYSPQYRRNYAVALDVVEKFARRHALMPRINGKGKTASSYENEIEALNKTIVALQKRRDGFIESLDEKRKMATLHNQSTI